MRRICVLVIICTTMSTSLMANNSVLGAGYLIFPKDSDFWGMGYGADVQYVIGVSPSTGFGLAITSNRLKFTGLTFEDYWGFVGFGGSFHLTTPLQENLALHLEGGVRYMMSISELEIIGYDTRLTVNLSNGMLGKVNASLLFGDVKSGAFFVGAGLDFDITAPKLEVSGFNVDDTLDIGGVIIQAGYRLGI